MNEIAVSVSEACTYVTDNPDILVGFVRMITHQLAPELWVKMVAAINPDWIDAAHQAVRQCVGDPT
jgi:hypothetical protein